MPTGCGPRKRGRPPRTRAKEVEVLVRHCITKEIRICLKKCDAQQISSRSSSSMAIEPPPMLELEPNDDQLPTPTSSVASWPPVLRKEVGGYESVPKSNEDLHKNRRIGEHKGGSGFVTSELELNGHVHSTEVSEPPQSMTAPNIPSPAKGSSSNKKNRPLESIPAPPAAALHVVQDAVEKRPEETPPPSVLSTATPSPTIPTPRKEVSPKPSPSTGSPPSEQDGVERSSVDILVPPSSIPPIQASQMKRRVRPPKSSSQLEEAISCDGQLEILEPPFSILPRGTQTLPWKKRGRKPKSSSPSTKNVAQNQIESNSVQLLEPSQLTPGLRPSHTPVFGSQKKNHDIPLSSPQVSPRRRSPRSHPYRELSSKATPQDPIVIDEPPRSTRTPPSTSHVSPTQRKRKQPVSVQITLSESPPVVVEIPSELAILDENLDLPSSLAFIQVASSQSQTKNVNTLIPISRKSPRRTIETTPSTIQEDDLAVNKETENGRVNPPDKLADSDKIPCGLLSTIAEMADEDTDDDFEDDEERMTFTMKCKPRSKVNEEQKSSTPPNNPSSSKMLAGSNPSDKEMVVAVPSETGFVLHSAAADVTTEEEGEVEPMLQVCDLVDMAKSIGVAEPCLPLANIMWYCCVAWDSKILEELRAHEEATYLSNTSIGKLFSECLKNEGHSFPGIAQMDWKKPFIVVDIITNIFDQCGSHRCLRVQEKVSTGLETSPPQWDLVIPPECNSIGEEMVRRHRCGVKTSVVIWGAYKDKYEVQWQRNSTTTSIGELHLRPKRTGSDVLSVIIFHHETLTHERFKLIQGPHPESELWSSFQNPKLQHRIYIQAELKDRENPTHFTLHAEKREKAYIYLNDTGDDLCEFPEFDSADEDEFGEDFDIEHEMDVDDDLENLESASRMGVESRAETIASEYLAAAARDVHTLAERIFRRSESLPAAASPIIASPPSLLNGMVSEAESMRRNSTPLPIELCNGDRVVDDTDGGREGQQMEDEILLDEDGYRIPTDSDLQFLLSQEVRASDGEEENGDDNNVLQRTVLNANDNCTKVDEGAKKTNHISPPSAPQPPVVIPVTSVINWGVSSKKKGESNQKACNGVVGAMAKRKQNGNGGNTARVHNKNLNGTGKSIPQQKKPIQQSPSNTEHSEYNYTQLLQEF